MPKYTANAYLIHEGAIVQTGQDLELSEEQAAALGDKVSQSEAGKLEEFTVAELKEQAKAQGIEGYNDLKKAELVAALSEK